MYDRSGGYDRSSRSVPMEIALTLEQRLQLRQLRDELEELNREQLIAAVLEEREDLLLQQRYYVAVLEDAGMRVEPSADICIVLPKTEEELVAVFGHRPSDEELSSYCEERILAHQEAARMDVDIEAIALGLDEE